MKVFKFRLEALLLLRKKQSGSALEAYGCAVQETRELEKEYERIIGRLSTMNDRVQEARKGVFSVLEQEHFFESISDLRGTISKVSHLQGKAKEVEKTALNALLEAKKEEEILSRLKEKKSKLYLQEFLREEEKILEDVINSKRLRAEKSLF